MSSSEATHQEVVEGRHDEEASERDLRQPSRSMLTPEHHFAEPSIRTVLSL